MSRLKGHESDNQIVKSFCCQTQEQGIVGIKGHRTAGGFRASLYNALPISSVQVLVDIMRAFTNKYG